VTVLLSTPTKPSPVIQEDAFLFCHAVISGCIMTGAASFDGAGAIVMVVNF